MISSMPQMFFAESVEVFVPDTYWITTSACEAFSFDVRTNDKLPVTTIIAKTEFTIMDATIFYHLLIARISTVLHDVRGIKWFSRMPQPSRYITTCPTYYLAHQVSRLLPLRWRHNLTGNDLCLELLNPLQEIR